MSLSSLKMSTTSKISRWLILETSVSVSSPPAGKMPRCQKISVQGSRVRCSVMRCTLDLPPVPLHSCNRDLYFPNWYLLMASSQPFEAQKSEEPSASTFFEDQTNWQSFRSLAVSLDCHLTKNILWWSNECLLWLPGLLVQKPTGFNFWAS